MTPLYWADPPGSLLQRIYRDARSSIPYQGGNASLDSTIARQPYLRRVSEEYGRRLARAGIYVEGETDMEDDAGRVLAEALEFAQVVHRVLPIDQELDRVVERALRERPARRPPRKLSRRGDAAR